MAHVKEDAYDKLVELLEDVPTETIVVALCNYYSTLELMELIEFLENEV